MTLLRGYAENLPLDRWLNEKVFPFEDRLNCDRAYYAIYVDKKTGVNYLFTQSGYAGGLCVLVDRDGKPIVSPLPVED